VKARILLGLAALATLWYGPLAWAEETQAAKDPAAAREVLMKAFRDGNFKDAYDGLRAILANPAARLIREDVNTAVQCLQRLNRMSEIDDLLESAIKAHQGDAKQWTVLWYVADAYRSIPHYGTIVAGKFYRGPHRGGTARWVNAMDRDRLRGLQLMTEALPHAQKDDNHDLVSQFLLSLADMLQDYRGRREAWRLQYKTDLTTLPDYEDGWGYYFGGQPQGAPVDEAGNPVFYSVPKRFDAAVSDGQRWRWCLQQAMEFNAAQTATVRMRFADFLQEQFGVQTLAFYGWPFGRMATDDSESRESGIFALHTLAEDETIARLATGVKRFKLPDEFNYIKIYQEVANSPDTGRVSDALQQLAQVFENRRQYPKAADYWRQLLARYPAAPPQSTFRMRLSQIVDPWGRFEPVMTQPAGSGATVEFRFRNGKAVDFTAHAIKVEKLLDDVKAYIKGRPAQLQWDKANIGDIGYRLVVQNQQEYVGQQVAAWHLDLDPLPKHFDRRITVSTPLVKAGAYLVKATMANGNTCYIILWLHDTAIVKKPLSGKAYYYVADAVTGAPVPKANVELFGWKQQWMGNNRFEISTKHFAEFTDADGQLMLDAAAQPQDYQWLITARSDTGRFAYLGFTGIWYGQIYDPEYNATKVFPITDRPVYRPDQAVQYKFWVRHARYDQPDTSDFAGQTFNIEIYNPKGEKVVAETKTADAYGGLEGKYKLPADATLGQYSIQVKQGIQHLGAAVIRVEEYKKPEFEVTVDAPKDPVTLGEKVTATITAKYYFGSPVTKAKVKYKINRTSYSEDWYPIGPWDWLFGRGYWWFAYDCLWYPGWHHWGCVRPMPIWWPHAQQPPELVADREVEIGPDGKVKVEIDTALAKALHGDQDHSYSITAEVVDASRRTIVGSGSVLVSREPYKVYAWVDRGYYRVGDTIHASFNAHRLDGKPVEGKGQLTLYRVSYKKQPAGEKLAKPQESVVQTWKVDTDNEGQSQQQLTASQAGQYRLSYKLTDAAGHTIEGGYLFTVIGAGFDSAQFRFNHIELVPDKADYAPGDKVKLQVNTDRADGTVLLFLRPTNGVYQPPQVIRLDGKSTIQQFEVTRRDMPNFFVEAVTVADGRVHSETKQIVVPPEKRVLNVEVLPSATEYRPGQKAKVKVRLTDYFGKPFAGTTALAIYDKSVEYISGGSNVPEIKDFFWKWQRHHNPQGESNLGGTSGNLVPPGKVGMSDLGVFGATVADMNKADEGFAFSAGEGGGSGYGLGRGFGGGGMQRRMAVAEAMPMEKSVASMSMDAAAAPAPMVANGLMMAEAKGAREELRADRSGAAHGMAGPLVQPTLRTKFADTALWVGTLATDADGTAEVALDMPENLTTWRIKVWGMGHGTKVGQGQTDVVTRKDLIIRLESPRFFVQTDEVVLSAVVHNYLKTAKQVTVQLELGGRCLEVIPEGTKLAPKPGHPVRLNRDADYNEPIEVPAGGEARVDWRVKVLDEGEAIVRMKALTDEESDAMEQKFPCYIHGMLKTEAWSGAIRPKDSTGRFTLKVPAERRPAQSQFEVRYSPTLAGAMVDALPYLVDYPYGCTEQTLNRFLPTVITQKILLDMHLNLDEIRKKRTNLNAQEIGDDRQRAEQWKRYPRNPVFDEDEVRRMVKDGVNRLTEMQLSDGGWGWFSGWGEHSFPHTTALVVHGLQLAQRNDVALVPGILDRGVAWLERYQAEQVQLLKNAAIKPKPPELQWKEHADELDAFVFMVLVDAGKKNADMDAFLYRDRTKLAVYALSMYGIALEGLREKDKLDMVMRNIGQYVQQDDENQTAWLNLPDNCWWCWYGSEYEAQAYYLKLLARTDPKGELAPRLVKYLLNNRKNATYWNSTRDTAICVEAMAEYLRASGEDRPEMTVEVLWDGKLQRAVEITPQTLFQFDNRFVLSGTAVTSGQHEVVLKKKGRGPLYYNGYLTNFTLEKFITKAGLEIRVNRKYYKLEKADKSIHVAGSRGQALDQKVEKYNRRELTNLAELTSGDQVEVELEIDSKNDYEYIVFEDMKPAGFEPVELRSGYTGNDLGAYVEFRDNRVVFFARTLARGKHSVSYRMRAETPGQFSALPTRAWAMYAPELKANSDELKLKVNDK
jgi:alpha-2-macroglobulin